MDEQLETIAFRMRIHSGQAAEYKRRHDEIWPELLALLVHSGVIDYRIWLDPETRFLFAQLTRTRDHKMEPLANNPIMRRWWEYMADIMEVSLDNAPVQHNLTPVFGMQIEKRGGANKDA